MTDVPSKELGFACLSESQYNQIQFFPMEGGRPWLALHSDGRITVDDCVTADEAARRFLDSLRELFPHWVASLRTAPGPETVMRWRCVSYCGCNHGTTQGHFVRDDEGGVWVRYEDLRAAQPPGAE